MKAFDSQPERRITALLLAATLFTSVVHFVDNAFHLDLYPGPIWLTRDLVLLAWLPLPLLAFTAFKVNTRASLVAYAFLGFAGLAHYTAHRSHPLPLRCSITILGEAIASIALIAYVLRPRYRS